MRTRQRSFRPLLTAVFAALAVLCLLAGMHPAFAAAFTSTQSGNWNDANTWGGAGIPVSGDTVTLANGFTVTVPSGYTAVCGTSPADDTGTPAIQCSSSSGTGVLVVNGTLQYKGSVRQANATWTVGAGGTLTYDASGAATPATALYSWQIGQANSQANAKLVFAGSAGSHVNVNSVGNVQSGGFGNTGTGFIDGGRVDWSYADLSYMGPATTTGAVLIARLLGTVGVTIDHCTLDNCGQINTTGLAAAATLSITHTRITNPANTSFTIQTLGTTARTTGVRLLSNNDTSGRIFVLGTGAVDTGFTVRYNLFRNRDVASATAGGVCEFGSGGSVTAWDQNLLALITGPTTSDPGATVPNGSLTNTYLYRQVNPSHSNTHPVYMKIVGASQSLDGWIIHYTGTDTNGDMFEPNGADAASARTTSIVHSIFLPNAAGDAVGSYLNNSSGTSQTNTQLLFDHNTCAAGGSNANFVYGVGAEAGTTWPAGAIQSARSNLLWRPVSGSGVLFSSASTATIADGTVTVSDYNATYNVSSSIYGMLAAKYAATPGTHDLSPGSPQFVDSSRSLLSFDQGYLGQPVATAWANSTAYVVGDVVSASTSTFFSSATYNYRCTAAHTSATATDKPGSGSAWSAKWEPAALQTISDSILAGTTYSAGANSLIGELVAWVKAGYAPRNSALRNAGHDSVTIGAVEGLFGRNALRAGSAGVVQ